MKREIQRGDLTGTGVARYAQMLEFAPVVMADVGGTPLIGGARAVLLKDEGPNRTGSIAARAAACAAPLLKAEKYFGDGELLASLAMFAAAEKKKAEFYFTRPVSEADWLQASLGGARVFLDKRAPADVRDVRAEFSSPLRDGWSTIAFEIAEQMEWKAPARMFIADGRRDEAAAMATGFAKLKDLGWIAEKPEIVLVGHGDVEQKAVRNALESWTRHGILLSPEGALAAAASERGGNSPVVAINPSRGEKHLEELRALAGVRSSVAFPSSLRVGGVISPQ